MFHWDKGKCFLQSQCTEAVVQWGQGCSQTFSQVSQHERLLQAIGFGGMKAAGFKGSLRKPEAWYDMAGQSF